MLLLVAFFISATYGDSMIELGVKEFIGEDKKVAENLRKRIQGIRLPLMPLDFKTADNFLLNIKRVELAETRRNMFIGEHYWNQTNILKKTATDIMQQIIYQTQYRMKDLQKILDKHSSRIEYRLAFIFCRLDTLLNEMNEMNTRSNRSTTEVGYLHKNRVYTHILYYLHMLKKNTDVTYIVEHVIDIYTKYMASGEYIKSKVAGIASPVPQVTEPGKTAPDGKGDDLEKPKEHAPPPEQPAAKEPPGESVKDSPTGEQGKD